MPSWRRRQDGCFLSRASLLLQQVVVLAMGTVLSTATIGITGTKAASIPRRRYGWLRRLRCVTTVGEHWPRCRAVPVLRSKRSVQGCWQRSGSGQLLPLDAAAATRDSVINRLPARAAAYQWGCLSRLGPPLIPPHLPPPAEEANLEVVERWGCFQRVARPGLGCVWCCLGETVAGRLSTSLQHQEVQFAGKTRDGVWVEMVVSDEG